MQSARKAVIVFLMNKVHESIVKSFESETNALFVESGTKVELANDKKIPVIIRVVKSRLRKGYDLYVGR